MIEIIDIESYQPQDNDKLFFDTNIWMYFYCPIGNYKKPIVKKYDGFLKKVLQVKSSVFISSLILSEFFNAYSRLEFNILKRKEPSRYRDYKKDFRETEAYKALVVDIKATVRTQILKIARRLDDQFRDMNMDDLFEAIEESDFNDNYYLALAEIDDIKIVTNDADFGKGANRRVQILTANRRLLDS